MSRRSKRNLLGCSSWPLCCCKRRCRLSWRRSRLLVSNSSVLSSMISFIFMVSLGGGDVVPTQKLRAHGQLVRCQPKRFTRDRLGHAVQLKQNVARPHRRDPMFGLTLAFAHARFWRAGGHRFIGKNADPQLAFALHVASKGHTRSFELRVGDPGALECLQSELAKIDSEVARSCPLATSSLGLAILHTFRHQWHGDSSLNLLRNWQRRWRGRWHGWLSRRFFFLTDPAFHADLAVNRVGFGETVINSRPKCVQRNLAFTIPFRTRDLRAIETPRATQANPIRAKIHRRLHRFFHRAAIRDPAFNL